jgi:hypothetical protein
MEITNDTTSAGPEVIGAEAIVEDDDASSPRIERPASGIDETFIAIVASNWFLIAIAVLLLLPLIWYEDAEVHSFVLALPCVTSGDEPHYLLILNSVINDGDLDVRNNYKSAHAGSDQAGKRHAGRPLDHHTVWYVGGKKHRWSELFFADKWRWDEHGDAIIPERRATDVNISNDAEYSVHPPGLAFLLAPFVYLFRGTAWVEPIALLCSGLATVLAMFLFNLFLKSLGSSSAGANIATMLAFLGTPAWHYGRTLFTEPFLLLFAVAACYFAIARNRYFIAGVFIGLGLLLKGPILLLAIPLAIYGVVHSGFSKTFLLALPVCLAIAVQLLVNRSMSGASSQMAMPFTAGNFLTGSIGLLFSPYKGMVFFLPVLLLPLATLRAGIMNSKEVTVFVGFCFYFLIVALWKDWHGGHCFGPRLIVPAVPLLLVGLRRIGELWNEERYLGRLVIVLICGFSLLTNAIGAFQPGNYGFNHPFIVLLKQSGGA